MKNQYSRCPNGKSSTQSAVGVCKPVTKHTGPVRTVWGRGFNSHRTLFFLFTISLMNEQNTKKQRILNFLFWYSKMSLRALLLQLDRCCKKTRRKKEKKNKKETHCKSKEIKCALPKSETWECVRVFGFTQVETTWGQICEESYLKRTESLLFDASWMAFFPTVKKKLKFEKNGKNLYFPKSRIVFKSKQKKPEPKGHNTECKKRVSFVFLWFLSFSSSGFFFLIFSLFLLVFFHLFRLFYIYFLLLCYSIDLW